MGIRLPGIKSSVFHVNTFSFGKRSLLAEYLLIG